MLSLSVLSLSVQPLSVLPGRLAELAAVLLHPDVLRVQPRGSPLEEDTLRLEQLREPAPPRACVARRRRRERRVELRDVRLKGGSELAVSKGRRGPGEGPVASSAAPCACSAAASSPIVRSRASKKGEGSAGARAARSPRARSRSIWWPGGAGAVHVWRAKVGWVGGGGDPVLAAPSETVRCTASW